MANEQYEAPIPAALDSRLRLLDKFVGTWHLHHRAFDRGEEWEGQDTYEWMDGGHFLAYHHEEFGRDIKGTMIVGFEQRWREETPSADLIGHWFESTTGNHFVYIWEPGEDSFTFWLEVKGSDAAFRGTFSDDRNTVTGAWCWPGGGYELTMTRSTGEQG